MDYLGSEEAIALVADSVKGLSLSVSRTVTFNPGSPFVGSATVTYGATVLERAGAPAVELGATFAGQLQIDILQDPRVNVQFGVSGAGLSSGAGGAVFSRRPWLWQSGVPPPHTAPRPRRPISRLAP